MAEQQRLTFTRISTSDWVQIVTSVAVLIGLALVVWELQQARELTKAQLISDHYSVFSDRFMSQMGDSPSASIAKACHSPEDLSDEDIHILTVYFNMIVMIPNRMHSISRATGLYSEEEMLDWASSLNTIFGTPYGRYWWKKTKQFYRGINPKLVELGDKMFSQLTEEYNCTYLKTGYLEELPRQR